MNDTFEDQTPTPELTVEDLQPYSYADMIADPFNNREWNGSKFAGGFGDTSIFTMDYWTLRARSAQLFKENLYARGIIRRLVTNEINTGLTPEATPDEKTLGLPEDSLNDWTEDIETSYDLWARTPALCDFQGRNSFGRLQAIARMEALVCGDLLQVFRYSSKSHMPQVQLISGSAIQSPMLGGTPGLKAGNEIVHGVELDPDGRHVAFWIQKKDLSYERLPSFGPKSGRIMARMVYGGDKRMGEVRGEPILALMLQSLKEIDRYRDSAQRKAIVNSFVALFIKKTVDKPGTLPMTGGAVRRSQVGQEDFSRPGEQRKLNVASYLPGMIMDELQTGEEPVMKGGEGTDVAFGTFEDVIVSSLAWALEIPPEILKLSFSNNYSASQAAINEFKIYLNKVWSDWGEQFCHPAYTEWMIGSALANKINAPTFLDAWRDQSSPEKFVSWTSADWYGSIKPSTDMLKQVKGSDLLVAGGYSTRAREARITTGTKFSKNIKRLKRENQLLVEATTPLLEMKQKFNSTIDVPEPQDDIEAVEDTEIKEMLAELGLDDRNTA